MQDLSRMSDDELRALYAQSQGGPAPVAPPPTPAAPIIVRRANPAPEIRAQNADARAEAQLALAQAAARRAEEAAARDARGNLPTGWEFGPDGTPRIIPGLPPSAATGADTTQGNPEQANGIRTDALDKIALARRLIARSRGEWFGTGFLAPTVANMSGTPAADIAADVETLRAGGAINEVMRLASTNGGKNPLTPLSNADMQMLGNSLSNLDIGQSDEQFQRNVQSIINLYERAYMASGGTPGTYAQELAGRLTPEEKQDHLNALVQRNAPAEEVRAAAQSMFGANEPSLNEWLGRYEQGDRNPVAVQGNTAPPGNGGGPSGGGGINPSASDLSARDGNPLDSFFRSAANMATAGFGNKIAAGVNAVLPIDRLTGRPVSSVWDNRTFSDAINPIESISRLGDAFDRNLALETRTTNADRQANPLASVAGDVTGGVMAAGLAARYAPGVASARALSLPALGFDAAYGATVAGNEASDRGQAVLPAAGMGAGVGAIGGTLGRGVIAPLAARALATRPGQAVANSALAVANAPRNAVRGMMGRSPVPAPRVTPPPAVSPQQALLARNVADPAAAGATLGQAQGLGLPMALADTSPALRRLAGAAFRRSGDDVRNAAEATVSSRSLGQADRALGQIESNFGPLANPNRVSEDLLNQARTASRPFYEAFRAEPARSSDTLDQILRTGEGQAALNRAYQLADTERVDPLAMGFDLDAQGDVILTRAPSPATLDYVKRGFDDTINGYKDLFGNVNLNDQGRAVEGLRQAFVSEMDRLYPNTYPAARAAYAGPASEREALNMGRDAMRRQPRDIADQMARYSPTQQEQYRLGARVAMGDRVNATSDARNPYNALYGSPVQRQRLSAMYPQEQVDRFGQAYGLETEMGRTAQELLGGSPTAARSMADQEFGNSVMDHAGTAVVDTITAGGPWRAAMNVGRNLLGDRMQLGLARGAQARADALLPDLLNTDPVAARAIMDEAIANSASRNNFNGRMRRVGGMFGYGAAGTALPLLSQ